MCTALIIQQPFTVIPYCVGRMTLPLIPFFREHIILFWTSLPICICEIDACQEKATQVVWPRKEAIPRLGRKTDPGDGTTRVKKAMKTEAEMDGLCQPRHESHRNDERRGPCQNRLEENCVCRSDPTAKWERLDEEDDACPLPLCLLLPLYQTYL